MELVQHGQDSRHCTRPTVPQSHSGQRAQDGGSWQCGQPNASSWYRSTCTVHDTKPNLLCSWLVASRSTVSGLALASGGGREPRSAPQPPALPLGLCEPAQGTHSRPRAPTPRGGSASAPRRAGRGCPSPRSLPAAPPSLRRTGCPAAPLPVVPVMEGPAPALFPSWGQGSWGAAGDGDAPSLGPGCGTVPLG